ncbi:hypothetical protein CXB51_028039 [Gossypium anomalum]|uniref:Uncharacterized protein n=1 Tax=Gossypium anomalum TaxID=47600 RepID=A0A8J6CN02_9ROSI|nr:hypothetical protein CXB51_028039 [Gossypium anomalum]
MMVFRGINSSNKVNNLHVLNLTSKEWIQTEYDVVAPSPHESHTTTFVGEDKVVIFKGSGKGETVSLNDFHVLDLRTMRWTSPTMRVHISIPKDSHSAIAIGNKLVVYGGDCGDRYHGDVDVFDKDNSIWSRLTVQGSLLGVGASYATVSIGIKIYMANSLSRGFLILLSSQNQTFLSMEGVGRMKHPIKELLVLQLGAQYPNGRYNMCTSFGSHWTQEERRVLRVAQNNLKTMYLGDNEVSKQEAHENRIAVFEYGTQMHGGRTIHNLLDVKVRGKVDGAFDSGCKTLNPSLLLD